ncbi:MAG: SulP family inorganic anion transporter [Chitinophagaceae bacterium]|nr:SulP family inorganic anion transporter [Chitinophagaceae bacterium]MCU0403792.1 SulP family inorganic anion transporter [Chitinophagaceae bacterium]
MSKFFKSAAADLPASIVVFLVALPLCLGVAVASDAAPITGIIAGMVGGIIIGIFSGSQLSVSGPAAGLTAIVAGAIGKLPSYEVFLVAVVLAGIFQIGLGYAKAGIIGDFIPNSVIKAMLAAIGLILILKQFPHLIGYDADPIGDEAFLQKDNENTFTEIFKAFSRFTLGAVIIGLFSIGILLIFELKKVKKQRIFQFIPGPLIVVIAGVLLNLFFRVSMPDWALSGDHLVQLDAFSNPVDFFKALPSPDFTQVMNKDVIVVAVTIALVASIETLLSIEAVDKIDPQKRLTPTNRELKAQGIGNLVSGLLGGLPVTSVIVRSSANVSSGAKTKLSTISHGVLLLLSVLFIPNLLNLIPKAALAAILIMTGYKLAKVSIFKEYYKKGWSQFIPFIVTVVAILLTDLLVGIFIGLLVGIYFVLKSNYKSSIFTIRDENRFLIRFRKEVTFLNKAHLKEQLEEIPDNTSVLVDATKSEFIDNDIVDLMNDFIINAETRNIRVYIKYAGGENRNYFNDIAGRVIK